MAPPGLTALGAKGSVRDRLRLTGGLRAFAQGSYEVSLRWRGTAPYGAPFFMPPLAAKTFTTALRAREMQSPFGGWRHHLPPRGAVGLWVLSHGAMSLQESIETYSAP